MNRYSANWKAALLLGMSLGLSSGASWAAITPTCGTGSGCIGPTSSWPQAGGVPVYLIQSGASISLWGNAAGTTPFPWDCTGAKRTFDLGGSGSPYDSVSRTGTNFQQMTVLAYNPSGYPYQFGLTENSNKWGVMTLLDTNSDGKYDTLTFVETDSSWATIPGGLQLTMNFQSMDSNNDGYPDFISVPWQNITSIGNHAPCPTAPTIPQVWVPVTRSGQVIFDLNGNGFPDPDLLASPPIGAAASSAVPAAGDLALALLMLALAGVSWQALRRDSGHRLEV